MQTSQEFQSSASVQSFYHQPGQGFDFDPYCSSPYKILQNPSPDISSQGINLSFQTCQDQYITLESSSVASDAMQYDSPLSSSSGLTNRSPFSTQASSQSYLSDPHHSCDQYGSPMSGSSVVNDEYEQRHRMIREVELFLLGPDSESGGDSCNCCSLTSGVHQLDPVTRNQIMEIIPRLDLKELLELCAKAFTESNTQMAMELMLELEKRVSVCGDPIQRVGAYMLEGLRARLGASGSLIYKRLKCTELSVPTSADLMSYMGVLFTICPFWKFAYRSANIIIQEAMEYEPRIHIIDFQIAQGTQWVGLMEAIASRARAQGRPLPSIRVTGVDDSQSALARGGGLELVGLKLRAAAESWGFQFEFHNAAMCGSDVELHNLGLHHGEAIAVNFPYVLHHMSDESVSTDNHRDRLLRLVKSLSPKVMTLVEQESNTNTSPFLFRFREMLDYYTAMFECIDAGSSNVESKKRINAEQQCIARDIVNMIACEGSDRVERHELFRKWQLRLQFAGFQQCRLSRQVVDGVRVLLKDFHKNYRVEEKDGALYLGWLNRAMVTSSAWR